ncbi:MAG: SDR family oxidoreductase [Alphaproteobacteria bacterium]|nr:SDR family oxidoreductase [Alphaproteobacteria bacterium]
MAGMLAGKAALITGAGNGIGRATALLFAEEGARVAAADLNLEGAEETAAAIREAGGEAVALGVEVVDAEQVEAMLDAAAEAFGRIDCAFNNAGIGPANLDHFGRRTHEWTEDGFDRMIAVNLKGVWLCMKGEIERMKADGGGGAIVNTSSVAGLLGLPGGSAYVAAKHAVSGLTRTAGIEYASDGIRVNAVCPGYIATDMTREVRARRGNELMNRVPARRMGEAQEIAEMVCWLCSDRSSYVTGATYNVDGGYVAS